MTPRRPAFLKLEKEVLMRVLPAIFLSALLAGCASAPPMTTADGKPVTSEALTGVLLPAGAVFKPEQSLVIGTGEQWVGRVVADVGRDVEGAFRYFQDTWTAQGWTLISAVRGKTSLLVFTKQDRTATVELAEGTLVGGGQLTLTVSPRNATVAAPRKP